MASPDPKASMFSDSVAIQKASKDIVIYSAVAKQIVRVAWLVSYF